MEDGFYWVRVRIEGGDAWIVAELEYGTWSVPGRERRFKQESLLEVDERRLVQEPYLKIEVVTPERAATMVEKVHARYRRQMGWDDPEKAASAVEFFGLELKKGWRPECVVDTVSGEVYDGAYGLRALAQHSEPVEVAVLYVESPAECGCLARHFIDVLPRGWGYLQMAVEVRPTGYRDLREGEERPACAVCCGDAEERPECPSCGGTGVVNGELPSAPGWYRARVGDDLVVLEVVLEDDVLVVRGDSDGDFRVAETNWWTRRDDPVREWGHRVEMGRD